MVSALSFSVPPAVRLMILSIDGPGTVTRKILQEPRESEGKKDREQIQEFAYRFV